MARLEANGMDIEYEVHGDPNNPPMLLIMGLGAQLITWDDGFVDDLVERGFYVIRYDNRDSGLSTKMEAAGPADVRAAFAGDPRPAYTLDDLADDAVGVLDALHIPAAHIVGASMGGFIAQLVAINHPERTLSLTSIMSGPGGRDAIAPTPEAGAVLVRVPGPSREEIIATNLEARRVLAGEGNPFDVEAETAKVVRLYERSYYPLGFGRQFVAILAAKSRIPALRSLKVPTLVVHGADDPLVPPENGKRVAEAVPGARYLEFAGAGHNLPPSTWGAVADAIAETARQASPAARG
ncbi:MAG TPA: alpha/beta hydrolase [Candidatus Dormibacteraeota bacterium]|nr:alpha/beta hydrolase [Candidatus Dormibacteraeota bacterium]